MNRFRASRNCRQTTLVVAWIIMMLSPPFSYSQISEEQLESNLMQAREALRQLDELANNCLEGSDRSEPCTAFQQAVNGELLAGYVANCTVAKSWREDFAAEQAQDSAVTPSQSEALLRLLIDVEYLCGENALTRATDNVLPAYQLTRTSRINSPPLANSLQYQLDSARQNALINQQRDNLSRGLSSQSERNRRQVQRQFDRLELELIRQQGNQ